VLVSYQAPVRWEPDAGEEPMVRFLGRNWNKWLEVVELNRFSGHAESGDFQALLGPAAEATRQVRLVHGELEQAEALAAHCARAASPTWPCRSAGDCANGLISAE